MKPFRRNLDFLFILNILNALLAQWIAHRTSNPGVVGSSPTQGVLLFFIYLFWGGTIIM